jgi:hypothetical protein
LKLRLRRHGKPNLLSMMQAILLYVVKRNREGRTRKMF